MTDSRMLVPLGLLLCVTVAWAGDIRTKGQFISEETGGPPMQVSSSDKVANLNADQLDGRTAQDFAGVAELATAGSGVEVHWKNISSVPGVEIDQDCAVNTGCETGGDPAGFPVVIDQAGSYRLASNLTTSSDSTRLISIETSNVTLDLNGFTLAGPVTCTGTPVSSCSPEAGFGDGILVLFDSARSNVTIRNGSIEGMGGKGIECASHCKVVGVHVSQNESGGITASDGSIIENVMAFRNGDGGPGISAQGVVSHSNARGNANSGMNVTGNIINSRATLNGAFGFNVNGSIVNSTAEDNVSTGISLGSGTTAVANSSSNNGNGISGPSNNMVRNNIAFNNTQTGISVAEGVASSNSSISNGGDGFVCDRCLLTGNTSIDNGGVGAEFFGSHGAWGNNVLSGNTTTVSGTRVNLGDNACDGSTLC